MLPPQCTLRRLLLNAIGAQIGSRMLFADSDHVSGEGWFVSDQYALRMRMPPR
ncbi:hypothetical protein CORC01_00590 [Colletotrichum orchidophilum]|uniref:Uncharacterized protein n=1 Tax=Colletotrichum orchidophilum TaxID=1209926 RepID=A0A1G4BS82_9PEZI|nr:uncharacterized protein CORC01_00590 [Colletotrichum orchidophilum]OHF04251.1 hypothetical protein CORC01_00590 [Colletotrichum orchidophilum]